jgi:hypothetical protein
MCDGQIWKSRRKWIQKRNAFQQHETELKEKITTYSTKPLDGAFLLPLVKPRKMTFPIIFGILAVIIIIIRRRYRARNNREE